MTLYAASVISYGAAQNICACVVRMFVISFVPRCERLAGKLHFAHKRLLLKKPSALLCL